MHELVITENILDIALRYADREEAAKITDLFLVVGDLSSVVDDSVAFYWDIVAKGSIAEGAALHFKRVPAEFSCLDCGYRFNPSENIVCDLCDSNRIKILSGQEFFLESIEIAENSNEAADACYNASQNELEQNNRGEI